MIEAVQLTKEFGEFTAVQDISLFVPEGEVLALLGPNGAGKTTTVRMLSAILKPTRGHARVAGYDTVAQAKAVFGENLRGLEFRFDEQVRQHERGGFVRGVGRDGDVVEVADHVLVEDKRAGGFRHQVISDPATAPEGSCL